MEACKQIFIMVILAMCLMMSVADAQRWAESLRDE